MTPFPVLRRGNIPAAIVAVLFLLAGFAPPRAFPEENKNTDASFIAEHDGSEQRYVLRLPPGAEGPGGLGVIIALHGHGSDRWQFIENPRDECRALRDAADRHGMAVLSPDYRAKTSWMGPAAEADMVQIIGEYRKQHRPERVVLAGGSMGASSALTFAALHPDLVDGVVALNPVANHVEYEGFQDAISASFGGDKASKPEEYRKRSAELNAERLTIPVALTVGDKDDVTPPAAAKRLAEKLKTLGRDVLLIAQPEGGHETNHADATRALEYVLEKTAAGKAAWPAADRKPHRRPEE